MSEIIASRTMNSLYIILDIIVLLLIAFLLLWKKRHLTFLFGLAGGFLYFLVDYGVFYQLLGTRHVDGADPFLFLFWLSMSFGFTNFVWIWMWLKKDPYFKEITLIIITGWLFCGMMSQNFDAYFAPIRIYRGTVSYHGIMAALLFIGYAGIGIYNMYIKEKSKRINILWLLATGIGVQFGWEAALLLCGIRAPGIGPLIVNSLLETNLGIPYLFFIQKGILTKWNEDLSRKTKGNYAQRPLDTAE